MSLKPVKIGVAVFFGLITTAVFPAALTPTAPAAEKKSEGDARLATLLREWEKADHEVRELNYSFQSTMEDRILRDKQISRGEAFVKKPNLLRIDWKDEKGKFWKTWIWSNGFLREYDSEKKEIWILRISSDLSKESLDRGWLLNGICRQMHQGLKWFYIGFPVNEMRRDYLFRLNKEDKYWAYIKIDPRTEREGDFKDLEVVLNQKTHLVRQIRCVDCCGRRVMWDFEQVEINPTPAITSESIFKNLPKDWKKVYLPVKKYDAIEIAKAFLDGKRIPYREEKVTSSQNQHDEWEILFVGQGGDSNGNQLVIVSDDGTEARLGSER